MARKKKPPLPAPSLLPEETDSLPALEQRAKALQRDRSATPVQKQEAFNAWLKAFSENEQKREQVVKG